MIKADATENIPVVDTSSRRSKEHFICECGATKFKWLATIGTLGAGGFKPHEYQYKCLGCGHVYSDREVRQYFGL